MTLRLAMLFVATGFVLGCGGDEGDGGDGDADTDVDTDADTDTSTGSSTSTDTSTGSGTGTGENEFLGSCDTRDSNGQCRDWNGTPGGTDLEGSCTDISGTFSETDACPADGVVGTCTLAPDAGVRATYRYYDPDYTEETAASDCKGRGGIFTGSGG